VGWVAAVVLVVTASTIVVMYQRGGGEASAAPRVVQVDFDGYRFGAVPTELAFHPPGTLGRPSWRIYTDPFAPTPALVLIRAAAPPADGYALALLPDVRARDLEASVFVKPIAGSVAVSGGIVWRANDQRTFHAALADGRRHQLEILSVTAGNPTILASAPIPIDIEYERANPTPGDGWYELQVQVSADRIAVYFAGQQVIAVSDPTRALEGGVGLIAQSDSVIAFDSLSVRLHRP
jgi:hypothetical protein